MIAQRSFPASLVLPHLGHLHPLRGISSPDSIREEREQRSKLVISVAVSRGGTTSAVFAPGGVYLVFWGCEATVIYQFGRVHLVISEPGAPGAETSVDPGKTLVDEVLYLRSWRGCGMVAWHECEILYYCNESPFQRCKPLRGKTRVVHIKIL